MTGAELISAHDARALTERIQAVADELWELVVKAWRSRVWEPLGYDTWADYCAAEFDTLRLRIPREERAEIVGSLRDAGMSLREIAAATGVSKDTVARSLSTVSNETVESDEAAAVVSSITGLNGKRYTPPAPRPAPPPPDPEPVVEDEQARAAREEQERRAAEEQQRVMEEAGAQELLNRWSRAVDLLTGALSYARTWTPPADIPDRYVGVAEFRRRAAALYEITCSWEESGNG